MNYLQKFQGGGSFGEAFTKAKKEGLDEFRWNGRWYTTEVKAEEKKSAKDGMSEKQRQADQIEKLNQSIIGNTAKAFQISPEDRKYIRSDVWDMVMQDHGNKIKPGSKEWKMLPRDIQSKIFNNDVTKGISENGSRILKGIGALTGGIIAAPAVGSQLVTAAIANPIATATGMIGSHYGGNYVNRKIQEGSNGQYQGVGDYIDQKTHGAIPQVAGDLLNPGTWAGGAAGSAAGNLGTKIFRNIPTMWNNAVGAARNNSLVGGEATIRVVPGESGAATRMSQAEAEAVGKASKTRTQATNKKAQSSYNTHRSGGPEQGGQLIKAEYKPAAATEYQPLPWVQTPNGYGVLPVFAPGQGPIAPAPKKGVRVEKVSDELAEWKSWYEKQPSGTYQSYPGGWPRKGWKGWIDRTGHDIVSPVREVYAPNPDPNPGRIATIIPDSTSRVSGVPNYGQRVLLGKVPDEAKRGNKTIKYKEGGLINKKSSSKYI